MKFREQELIVKMDCNPARKPCALAKSQQFGSESKFSKYLHEGRNIDNYSKATANNNTFLIYKYI